jgi:hypothetical protein
VVTHQTGIEEQEEQLLELFLFEAESRISQKKEENYAQKKNVAGVAATNTHCRLSEALRRTCRESSTSRGKVGARALPLHTHTHTTHVDAQG